jgi:hypothetical protein
MKAKAKKGRADKHRIFFRSCHVAGDISAGSFCKAVQRTLLIHDVERSGNMFSLASEKYQQLKKSEERT